MAKLKIQIPDKFVRGLEGIASAQKQSVTLVGSERLGSLLDRVSSRSVVLRAVQKLAHPSFFAADDLDAAIAAARERRASNWLPRG